MIRVGSSFPSNSLTRSVPIPWASFCWQTIRCATGGCGNCATRAKFSAADPKNNRLLDKINLNSVTFGNACRADGFCNRSRGGMGCLMNSLPDEYYVIQIDGRIKSGHRRFVDALREGLQLRDQFPHRDVKVRAIESEHRAA